MSRLGRLVRFVPAALAGVSSLLLSPLASRAATDEQIAYTHAPVLFQDTAEQGSNYSQDFLSRVDFDGDFVANNNWDHQPSYPHAAYVYYDMVETRTHWTIIYSFYHPRDWEQICLPELCHENDMENMRAVVKKDGSEYGVLEVVDLQAHGGLSSYIPAGSPVTSGSESIDGTLSFEGTHPRIYLEAHKHGPNNCDDRCSSFPGGDGVVYRPTGVAEIPPSPDESNIGYALLSSYAELWPRRGEIGSDLLWKTPFAYNGFRLGAHGRCMGSELTGDNWGGAGLPGWGYQGPNVGYGDWLFDAAGTNAVWYTFPERNDPGFYTYLENPYLDDLDREGVGTCTGGGCAVGFGPATAGSASGTFFAGALVAVFVIARRCHRRARTTL